MPVDYAMFREEVRRQHTALLESLGFHYCGRESRTPFVVFERGIGDGLTEHVVFQLERYRRSYTIEFSISGARHEWAHDECSKRERIGAFVELGDLPHGTWESAVDVWWKWGDRDNVTQVPHAVAASVPVLPQALQEFEKDYRDLPCVLESDPTSVREEKREKLVPLYRQRRDRRYDARIPLWREYCDRADPRAQGR